MGFDTFIANFNIKGGKFGEVTMPCYKSYVEVKNLLKFKPFTCMHICWNIKRGMFVYLPVEQCNRRTKRLLNAPLCSRGSSRLHMLRQYAATRWSENGYITHNESWAKRNEMKNCLNYSTQQQKKRETNIGSSSSGRIKRQTETSYAWWDEFAVRQK